MPPDPSTSPSPPQPSLPGHLEEIRRVFRVEIEGLAAVQRQVEESLPRAVDMILALAGKVIVTGLGKSGIVAHKIAATLSSTGTRAAFLNAAEALHGDLGMVDPDDLMIMVSNSGATVELIRMLPTLRRRHVRLIGLFGRIDTQLAAECDLVINAAVPCEACPLDMAPTASSTAALVVGDALACALMRARQFSLEDFALNHPGGSLGRRLLLQARDVMHQGDQLPIASPTARLREIAMEMTRAPLGAVCICDPDRTLLGIITEGDLRRHLARSDDLNVPALALMTRNPASAAPHDTLNTLLSIMESPTRKIYVLPVLDDQRRLLGMVRAHDLLAS